MTPSARSFLAEPGAQVPADIDNLLDLLRFRSETRRGALAFWDGDASLDQVHRLDAREILGRAFGVATALQDVRAGTPVGLLHPPGLDYITAFFGTIVAGAIPVPIYPPDPMAFERTLERLNVIVEDAGIRCLLTTTPVAQMLQSRAPRLVSERRVICTEVLHSASDDGRSGPAPHDIAFLQYTSGSTRSPRGVRVSHANLLHNNRAIQRLYGNGPGATGVSWLPPYHDMGLVGCIVQPIYAGFDVLLMAPMTFARRPMRWLQAISELRARGSGAPNFAYELCAQRADPQVVAKLDLSSWEVAFCGAEPVRSEALRRFAEAFAPAGFRSEALCPCYGLAEATLLVTGRPPGGGLRSVRVDVDALERGGVSVVSEGGRELVSCGPPIPRVGLRVLDPQTSQAVEGVGEIVVRGPSVADGYHGSPSGTSRTFGSDGLRTGDLGFLHGGELYVVGRSKELLIVRGRKLHPHDVEDTVTTSVRSAKRGRVVVVSWEGERDSSVVVIVEAGRSSGASDELIQEVRAAVRRGHQITAEVVVVPPKTIRRTSSGKLQRTETLESVRSGEVLPLAVSSGWSSLASGGDLAEAVGSQTEQILAHIARELASMLHVKVSDLDPRTSILELGFDSLAAAELQTEIQETHGVSLPMSAFAEGPSLQALAARIAGERQPDSGDRALLQPSASREVVLPRPSLFFFESAAVRPRRAGPIYATLERAVRMADEAGFEAVWLPERHFHEFGAPFPNPAVLAAALASQTSEIQLRAGSIVSGLQHPATIAESWAMVDQLSAGRVGLSFTAGWNARDYALAPQRFENRRARLLEEIEVVRALWRGERRPFVDGEGRLVELETHPRPKQRELPVWLTCTERRERFVQAGLRGYNVLTALLFSDHQRISQHIEAYRRACSEGGRGRGHVTLAVHTFVAQSDEEAREIVRAPLLAYLESSVTLWRQQSEALDSMNDAERTRALDFALERYTSQALIGSRETVRRRLERFAQAGVDEVACQTDFGLTPEQFGSSLQSLAELYR